MKNGDLLPDKFNKYFWDINSRNLNIHTRDRYVIERLLEYGDASAFTWLRQMYDFDKIKSIIKESNRISKKTANFYAHFFSIPYDQIRCLQKDFHKKHRSIWNY